MEQERSEHKICHLQDEDKEHDAIEEIETERRKTMRRSMIVQLAEAAQHEESSGSEDDDFEEYITILSKEKKEWEQEYLKRKLEHSQAVKQMKNQKLNLSEKDVSEQDIPGEMIDYEELKKKRMEFRNRLIQLKEITEYSNHLREQLLNYAEQQVERCEKQYMKML